MSISDLHAVWTVLLLLTFVGIAVWAYLSRNVEQFRSAAQIPFEADGQEDRDRV